MNSLVLEATAFVVALFCFGYSITVRHEQYFPTPKKLVEKVQDTHWCYLTLLFVTALAALSSVLGVLLQNLHASYYILNALHEIYYLVHNVLSVMFSVYMLNVAKAAEMKNRRFLWWFFLPFFVGELMIIFNPLTHACFYVDEMMVYHRGSLLWILYVIGIIYAGLGYYYFFRYKKAMKKTDRQAALILVAIALLGVAVQAVFSVLTELFFESVAFLGFLMFLEKPENESREAARKGRGNEFLLVIALIFISVIVMNSTMIYDITAKQIDKVGNSQLDGICASLQKTISDAESGVLKLAMGVENVLTQEESTEKLSEFIITQKRLLTKDSDCFNVYCAGREWFVIPDFDAPKDYHPADRIWYIGAGENPGEVYITEPYLDADSGGMCFTVATMLSDGETVVAMDYNFNKVQGYIQQMTDGEATSAMIVTEGGMIVGYTDMALVGEKAVEKLPDYSEVLKRVMASKTHDSFQTQIGGRTQKIFSNVTSNNWYLILSIYNGTLYAGIIRTILMMAVVNLLMVAVVVVFYMVSAENRVVAEDALAEREEFIDRLSDKLRDPLERILRLSDYQIFRESENPKDMVGQIKASGLQLAVELDNLSSYAAIRKAEAPAKKAEGREKTVTSVPSRLIRNWVVVTLLVAMSIGLLLCIRMTVSWGDTRMIREGDLYDYELSRWVVQQEGILNLFTDSIRETPELLDNYAEAVTWLDDIASQYGEISACYMANPYKEETVIMNTGWKPEPGWRVEERQWYRDTIKSNEGFSISAPYIDEQTGVYCITFSRAVYGKDGTFLGIFGIDFLMDKIIHILGESYTEHGYAFLVDANGTILNHPSSTYQMDTDHSVSVEDTPYVKAYHTDKAVVFQDYDGQLVSCLARSGENMNFTVMVVYRWWNVYGASVAVALAFLVLLLVCIVIIVALINRLTRWQEQINQQLAQSAREAVMAGQAKSRFLAQMSHEIRTPINAVLGMNDMILQESHDEGILEYAANIESAGKTLLSLINSILDFSKLEDGKMEIVQVKYETLPMIESLLNMIEERAAKKDLKLILKIDPKLPKSLYGDDLRIRQIIINLLTNAVKYTAAGSVTLSMKADLDGDECKLSVAVKDTGMGIRKEDMDKLFESFSRLDLEKNRNIEGTGLGISIIQGLLAMMDSKLEVESEYGKGSIFSFTINQMVIDREGIGSFEEYQKEKSVRQEKPKNISAEKARLLVVDDNELNLKVIRGLLKRWKITPELATSGDSCLAKLKEGPFDIVFLDHMMPVKDGVETLKEIHEQKLISESTPVVVLTANAGAGVREEYLALGFTDYLSKPVETRELLKVLMTYLPKDTYEEVSDKESTLLEAKKEAEKPQPFDAMTFLRSKGFQVEEALSYAGDDEAFYRELLTSFLEETGANEQAISTFLNTKDWDNYRIRVHALKSTARMIGAVALSEVAYSQEMAAKRKEETAIREGVDELLRQYKEVAGVIREMKERDGERS